MPVGKTVCCGTVYAGGGDRNCQGHLGRSGKTTGSNTCFGAAILFEISKVCLLEVFQSLEKLKVKLGGGCVFVRF